MPSSTTRAASGPGTSRRPSRPRSQGNRDTRTTGRGVDLSLGVAESRIASEAREWLSANVAPAPDFAEVAHAVRVGPPLAGPTRRGGLGRDRLARGVRGQGASPVEVAVFNSEYARSRAPQLINRVGINLAGPTLLAHGTPETAEALAPEDHDGGGDLVPALQRAGCGIRPVRAVDAGGKDRRRMAVSGQKVWTSYAQFAKWGLCLARSDPESQGARGLTLFAVDMKSSGVDIRPLVQMTGDAEFNEVFFDEVEVPDDQPDRRRPRGLGGGVHDARARARHELPVQGGSGPRGLPGGPFRRGRTHGERSTTRTCRTGWSTLTCHCVVFRTHNWRTLSKLAEGDRPRPGVELDQADLVGHDPGPFRCGGSACSVTSRRCGAAGSGSGSGARRRASPAAPRRCSAT